MDTKRSPRAALEIAAPDLLAACKAFSAWFAAASDGTQADKARLAKALLPELAALNDALRLCASAIAKAEGGAA